MSAVERHGHTAPRRTFARGLSLLVAAGLVLLGGCRAAQPDAGSEAVLVQKPILFGHGGVEATPVRTGLTYVAWTTQVIYVNMQPQQMTVHFDDLMSSDGVPLDFDSIIRLKINDSVGLIQKYGPNWYANNVEAEFRNRVRQAVRKHGMNETAISTVAIDAIDSEVSEAMASYIKRAGIPVTLIDVTIGKANPPDAIKHQRIDTATQEQRINTERQRKLAEDQRKEAELSRAAADNAYRLALGLSPEQFLSLEQIKMQREVCANEKTPCTFLFGGGVSPVLNVR